MKEIIGFILTALAAAIGYETAPDMLASFGSVLAAVYICTNLFRKFYGKTKFIQVISWVFGIIISLAAWYAGLGLFAEMSIYAAGATGLAVSLAANGVKDSAWIETVWKKIVSWL
jgi:hypothetical protein